MSSLRISLPRCFLQMMNNFNLGQPLLSSFLSLISCFHIHKRGDTHALQIYSPIRTDLSIRGELSKRQPSADLRSVLQGVHEGLDEILISRLFGDRRSEAERLWDQWATSIQAHSRTSFGPCYLFICDEDLERTSSPYQEHLVLHLHLVQVSKNSAINRII